ncbi:MAG: hypothetical protein E7620_06345 [Ruminococcaceae bacterium]|nr:hypothetical protein [Oscillospiraceae bacterium]
MKKGLALFLSIAMLLTGGCIGISAESGKTQGGEGMISEWDGKIPQFDMAYGFSGGDGSKYDPYLISSAYDLAMLAANVRGTRTAGIDGVQFNTYTGKHFRMTVDVDMKNHEWYGIGGAMPATGFGDYNYFAGVFDGDYHKIYNFNLAFYDQGLGKTLNFQGLFGYVGYGAEIRNIGIESGKINGSEAHRVTRVGCLVGGVRNNAIIENCYNKADLTLHGMMGAYNYIGCLIGTWMDPADVKIIKNCYNTGDLDLVVNNVNFRVGGLVGGILGAGAAGSVYRLENCFNTGKITVKDNTQNLSAAASGKEGTRSVGGLAGALCDGATMINCHSSGGVSYSYVNPNGQASPYYYCVSFAGFIFATLQNCSVVSENGLKAIGKNQASSSAGTCKEVTSIPFYTASNGFLNTAEQVTYNSEQGTVEFSSVIGSKRSYSRLENAAASGLWFNYDNNKTDKNFGVSLKLTDPFGVRLTTRMTTGKGEPTTYAEYLSEIEYGYFVVASADPSVSINTPEELLSNDKVTFVAGNLYGDTGYYYADLGGIAAHQLNTTYYIVSYYIKNGGICLSNVVTVDLAKTLESYAAAGNPYGFTEKEYNVYVTMLAYCKQYAAYTG